MSLPLAIGVDIGGSKLRAALVDRNGSVLRRAHTQTDAAGGPAAVIAQISGLLEELEARLEADRILGVGIAAPGPIDTITGVALGVPTLAGWDNVPIVAMLREALGVPVRLENDGIAAAHGERLFGAGRGTANMVYVTVSTGIGGGIILDGRLLHGHQGLAGHVGHMTIVRDGEPCVCGNTGCWEAYASGTAFTKRARERYGRPDDALDARWVFAAARSGDAVAVDLVREEADFLGLGIVNLAHLFSPEIIVIGGGMANDFDLVRDGIAARLRDCAMPAFRRTVVAPAELGDNSGLIGAAALFFSGHAAAPAAVEATL